MKGLALALIILTSVLAAGCQPKPATVELVSVAGGSYRDIPAEELSGMLKNKDFVFINVHIPFAGNIDGTDLSVPYDEIEQHLVQLPADRNTRVVLYCRSGRMSALAAVTMIKLGYTNVWNLKGGMAAWQEAGYPIEGQ